MANLVDHLKENKTSYYIQSLLFVILGILSIIIPQAAAIGMNIVIAIALILNGVIRSYHIIKLKRPKRYLITSLLITILGILMLIMPVGGATALAIFLGVYFLFESAFEISFAIEFWSIYRSILLIIAGIVSFILALLIFFGIPYLSIALLGIVIGVNFLIFGISLFILVRKASQVS
jgi:uncharacterized membrane protein HdeD (DUF308 family)